jgi:hypothetical protein
MRIVSGPLAIVSSNFVFGLVAGFPPSDFAVAMSASTCSCSAWARPLASSPIFLSLMTPLSRTYW